LLEASLCAVPVDPLSVVTARADLGRQSRGTDAMRDDADYRLRQADKLRLRGAMPKITPEHDRRLRRAEALRRRWPPS
jgi:hypothetical protein